MTDDDGFYNESKSNKKIADMKKRVALINETKPDIAVSIHQNSYHEESIKGAQVFYYTHSKEGERAATVMQEALKALDTNNKRQAKENSTYYMLKRTEVPTIIVECGFLSNAQEAEKLKNEEYQDQGGKTIYPDYKMARLSVHNDDIIKVMKTIIKKIDKNQLDTEIIAEAGEILEKGGLVAFPTETVYGLGANALNEEAARKTYEAKGRPSDNPLIVHIADIQALDEIVEFIPEKAKSIVEKFWPGPLTLIFEKSGVVPLGTTGGLQTVAVRMPEDEIARALIRAEEVIFQHRVPILPDAQALRVRNMLRKTLMERSI